MLGRMAGLMLGGGALAAAGSFGINRYLTTNAGDTENLEPGSSYRFLEGTFGGSNLLLNLGVGLGGNLAAKRFQARGQRLQTRSNRLIARQAHWQFDADGTFFNPTTGKTLTQDQLGNFKKSTQKAMNLGSAGARAIKTATKLRRISNLAAWAPIAFMAFDSVSSLSDMPAPDHAPMQRKSAALSGTFMDTTMAYTQRKRALQAMHNTQFTGRAGLGNEAALLHR